ncbi:OppA family ABC transporter substrate-binding lipoprotein [Mycoplasmopsis agalactiae]|uniref:Lipoprotein n=1 Tax=Mycoplasmopsis agalactiae TaxID=2110 RepID=D3VQY2_MYCAA|nr:hypothetical protein [Mycoplasmopsis agalactiae]KAB6718412.1 hypothetical protein E4L58_02795 [Mycoplasmopsis agalactiae]CBH40729.1 Conserved hypothetical protein, predictedlipoprotein [Mycoplasmopsis agalactiae]
MSKKILSLLPIVALPSLAISCNIRNDRSRFEYIKSINEPNYIKNVITNSNKPIENDHESLLSAPLIRWKTSGKAKFDNLNKKFFSVTSKYLEFELAQKINITLLDDKVVEYSKDSVKPYSKLSDTGIVNVTTDEEGNINNPLFIKHLKRAKKVDFVLKDGIHFVDKNGNKTGMLVKNEHFWNSYNYKNNLNELQNITSEYGIEQLKAEAPLTFVNSNNTKSKMDHFVTKVLTNNMIFMPLFSAETNDSNALFASPYVINSFGIDKAVYIKNNFYAKQLFVKDERTLKKVILKFNPVPIDEPTYRLQTYNAYRQNLISEASYNLFNDTQKEDIENNPKIYGLSFAFTKKSNENVNKYFYNSNLNKDFIANDAFSKLVFNTYKTGLNRNSFINLYSPRSLTFLSIINNLMNQYTATKLLGNNTYWNSFMPQSLYFDTESNSDDYLFNLINDINRIRFNYHNDGEFKTKTIEFSDFLNNNLDLKNDSYDGNKILDVDKQLKTSNWNLFKYLMKKLLDKFYEENSELQSQKIEWVIPIFSQKSQRIDNYYQKLISFIKSLDSRLNPSYKYVSPDESNYLYSYNSYALVNNSYAENLFALLDLENSSILTNIAVLQHYYDKKMNKPPFYEDILKIDKILKKLISQNWAASILSSDKSLNLSSLLNTYSKDIKTFKSEFINKINSQFNKTEQFALLRSVDDLLIVRQNETNYLFTNDYEKIIVQYFYTKPLNDAGFTYYQDIIVFS